jgi:hypothetical protein
MPNVGEQADILRALGRFLDDNGASNVHILGRELVLSVSWDKVAPGAEHRSYQDHELDSLRDQARALRTGGGGSTEGSLAEVLRTLGQELDHDGFEANGVIQEPDGWRVSGVANGRYATALYTTDELLERSAERRAQRGTQREEAPAAALDPFAGITVGPPVFTRDEQRIGKVAEVRGRHFKVDPGFLQRAYWLPAECVLSVLAGDRIVLTPTKDQLDLYKSANAPSGS